MKKVISFFLILVVMFIVAACSTNKNGDENQQNGENGNNGSVSIDPSNYYDYENYVFIPDNIEISSDITMATGMLIHNDRIYYWGSSAIIPSQTLVININPDGSDEQRVSIRVRASQLISLIITEDGNIAIIEHQEEWTGEGVLRSLFYAEFDISGTELFRYEFGNISPPGSDRFNIYGAAILSDGNIAISVSSDRSNSIYLLNAKTGVVNELSFDGFFGEKNIVSLKNGRVIVYDVGFDYAVFREIDFDSQSWGDSFPLREDIGTGFKLHSVSDETPFDFLLSTQTHLYGYLMDKNVAVVLISWVESNLVIIENEYVAMFSDGRYAMLSNGWSSDSELITELRTFNPLSRAEFAERTVITLGGMGIDRDMLLAVVDFNMQSRTHIIRVVDYMSNWQSYQNDLKRLHVDLITGKGPDILYAGEMGDIRTIAARGLLVDLYPFIDVDPELNRDDFFPNVLLTLENLNGTLPLMSNRFTVETIISTRQMMRHVESWTVATMRELIEANLNKPYLFNQWVNSESFLQTMIIFAGSELTNWDTYTANFHSEAFIQTLEIAKRLPSSSSYGEAVWSIEELYKGNMLFDITWLRNVEYFQMYSELLGDELVVLGMPTSDGGAHMLDTRIQMGINAASDHADFAWDFLREFLLPTAHIDDNFPIRIDLYDKMIAEEMEELTEIDEHGNSVIVPRFRFEFGGNEVSIYALRAETASLLRSIVESGRARGRFNSELMEIIMADFASFVAGNRTADDTARIIQSRVQIWLSEQELVFG
ncbi:MAG: extracellular solute-binding protein [Oscillospiraceae bacterium]|nr:extracellular solute-binding protein [Oscillospiraceae bacterium]